MCLFLDRLSFQLSCRLHNLHSQGQTLPMNKTGFMMWRETAFKPVRRVIDRYNSVTTGKGGGADSKWELRLECHAECNLWQQLLKDNKYDYFVQLHKFDNCSREDNPRFTFTIPRTNTWDGSSIWFQSPVFPLCWLLITSEAIKVIPFKMTSCLMHRPRFQIAQCVWTDGRTCNQSW